MENNVRVFLQELLKDAGQTNLSPELEEQMIQDLNSRLESRLILTAMENLSPEQQDELGKMAEENVDPKSMESFIKTNVADWEKVFSRVLLEFRDTYLGKN